MRCTQNTSRAIHLLLAMVVLVGCRTRTETPDGDVQYQTPVGGPADAPRGQMTFAITAVHQNQQPTSEPPFHRAGGDWTFLDCQATADPQVKFTVGVKSAAVTGNAPFGWGQAMLIVKDQPAGERFVSLFARSFPGAVPSPAARPYDPRPLTLGTAVLGNDLRRNQDGGFSGERGGWTATKWFPEFDGRAGEIYFNYSLAAGQGEFSEKEAEYADDLLAVFAAALRDGPRPERTPETDPNLTLAGPGIGPPRKLLPRRGYHFSFSPQNRYVVYLDESTILGLPLDPPQAEPFVLAKFDGPPSDLRVLNDDLDLLVAQRIPQTPGQQSSADPMQVWLVESKGRQKTLLRGPEQGLHIADAAASPDLRFLAFEQWQGRPGTAERCKVLFILDRLTQTEKTFRLAGEGLTLFDWRETSGRNLAVVVTNRWASDDEESKMYLADPETGTLVHQEDVNTRAELDNLVSPDQRLRARVQGHELVVTETAGGAQRQFTFHPDDWPFLVEECIQWASSQYVQFNGKKLALIDVNTMKMSYPELAGDGQFEPHTFTFSSDMRWVLYRGEAHDGAGLFLAPVETSGP